MIKCNHCGLELTDPTVPCPNCGTLPTENAPRNQKETLTPKKIIQTVITLAILVAIVCSMLHQCNPDNNILGIEDMRECYTYAQEVISEQLLYPPSAVFPDFEPEFVTQSSEKIIFDGEVYDVHTVTSYVDSQNMFGVMTRSNYQIRIGLPMENTVDGYYYEIIYFE